MAFTDDTTGLSTTWTEQTVVAFNYGMLQTQSDMIGEVQDKLKRGTLSATSSPTLNSVKRWLTRAKQELMQTKSYSFARRYAYATLAAGDYRISLPPDYNGGDIRVRDQTNDRTLKVWPAHIYDKMFPDPDAESNDEIEVCCIKNMELWLAPPTSGTPIIEISYDRSGQDTANILKYETQTGDYTLGLTVTGGTSEATGVIIYDTDSGTSGTLYLKHVTGTFADTEALTDSGSGAAVVDGTLTKGKIEDFLFLPEMERFRCCDYAIYEACESLEDWEKAKWYRTKWDAGSFSSKKADARRKWKEMGYRVIDVFQEQNARQNQQ